MQVLPGEGAPSVSVSAGTGLEDVHLWNVKSASDMTQVLSAILASAQFYLQCCVLDTCLNNQLRKMDGRYKHPAKKAG